MPADPLTRARRATSRMDDLREAMARLADERADAVRDALASGMSRTEVAGELGISRQALSLILKRQ